MLVAASRRCAGALAALLLTSSALAADPPAITGPITDLAGALSADSRAALDAFLKRYRAATGVQMAVLLVGTTGEVPIEDYARAVFSRWGGGDPARDDGLLLVLALEDRRNRLHTGYGLEGVLPDGRCARILAEARPRLRANDWSGAIQQIVTAAWESTDHIEPGGPIHLPFHRTMLFVALMALLASAGGAYWRLTHTEDADAKGAPAWPRPKRGGPPLYRRPWPLFLLVFIAGPAAMYLARDRGADVEEYPLAWLALAAVGWIWASTYRRRTTRAAIVWAILLAPPTVFIFATVRGSDGATAFFEIAILTFAVTGFLGILYVVIFDQGVSAGATSGGRLTSGRSSRSTRSSSSSWSGGGGRSGGGGASSSW